MVGTRSGLTRRTALGVAVAAVGSVLAGCRGHRTHATVRTPAQVDPDVTLAGTVLDAEQRVLDLVRATIAAHPALRGSLHPVARGHVAHIDLLAKALPAKPARSASPSPSGQPPASPSALPLVVPPHRAAAVRAVALAEAYLAANDRQSAFAALSGSYARALASMAASAAQQAAVLSESTKATP